MGRKCYLIRLVPARDTKTEPTVNSGKDKAGRLVLVTSTLELEVKCCCGVYIVSSVVAVSESKLTHRHGIVSGADAKGTVLVVVKRESAV